MIDHEQMELDRRKMVRSAERAGRIAGVGFVIISAILVLFGLKMAVIFTMWLFFEW